MMHAGEGGGSGPQGRAETLSGDHARGMLQESTSSTATAPISGRFPPPVTTQANPEGASNSSRREGLEMEGSSQDSEEDGDDWLQRIAALSKRLEKFWEVMRGTMSNLPAMPTNTVRIFLSSTFSDFKAERNYLPQHSYPQLEEFCASHGIDFQVVDMRWGVPDEVVHDHQVSPLCIAEIKTCQQLSCGPNFVVLLGDRYGWQGFPPRIQCKEFTTLMEEAARLDKANIVLINTWFKRDDNAVPPEYVLQPIQVHLKHYDDTKDHDKRAADQARWADISNRLQTILRTSAKAASQNGKFSEEQERKYFMSVTEEEIMQGIVMVDNPSLQVFCYHRSLQDIKTAPRTESLEKFTDLTNDRKDLDREAFHLRTSLFEKKLPSFLPKSNIREYQVKWKGIPLEKSQEEEHRVYLKKFTADFVNDMKTLINKRLTEYTKWDDCERIVALYHEVLHHAHFGCMKCDVFCGRDLEVAHIKRYLNSGCVGGHRPLILHGLSGMGKTALMAYVASCLTDWFGADDCVSAVRFLGTSPLSSSISDTLRSVVEQLSLVFHCTEPCSSSLDMFGNVRRAFHSLLENLSKLISPELDDREVEGHDSGANRLRDKRVVVLLDSVDQLSPVNGAHRMVWLPKVLPRNVYVIISMLTVDKMDTLRYTQQRQPVDGTFYLELSPLLECTCEQIMDSHLTRSQRRLTEQQRRAVIKAFNGLCHPLYLKLVIDKAKTWTSYYQASEFGMCHPETCVSEAVRAAIKKLFEGMEAKHGTILVRQALGYLTCGKGGLTDIEMEDVLSCDDDVLNEVYQYHEPPLEGVVRIPSLLWSRLQQALTEYICERRVDGKVVRAWYHRQFWEVAEECFLQPLERKHQLHRALADMFLQEQGVCRTIELHHFADKVIIDADRQVKPQPLDVTNIRKLQAVPYHLHASGQYDLLTKRCLVNFHWLRLRLQAFSINMVIREYESMDVHPDVSLFQKFLKMCFEALSSDPHLLAYNIVERLSASSQGGPLVALAVEEARAWLVSTEVPLLVPTHSVQLKNIDSPELFSLMLGYDGCLTDDERMIICPWSENNSHSAKIQTLDLSTRDIVASIKISKVAPFKILPNSHQFVFVQDQTVSCYEMDSGDMASSFSFINTQFENVTVRCLDVSQRGDKAAFSVRFGKPKNIAASAKWRAECRIFLVDLQQQTVLQNTLLQGRKPVDNLFFVKGDALIIGTSKNNLHVYDAERLTLKQEFHRHQELCANSFQHITKKNLIVGLCSSGTEVQIILFDYNQMDVRWSQNVHLDAPQKKVTPVAMHIREDVSRILVASWGDTGEKPVCSLCLWADHGNANEYMKYRLMSRGINVPVSISAVRDWTYVLVGWKCGIISVLDLKEQSELRDIPAHGHAIFFLRQLRDGNTLLTVSQDHYLKVWNVGQLLKQAYSGVHEERNTGPYCISSNHRGRTGELGSSSRDTNGSDNSGNYHGKLWLSDKEQCLDLVACSQFLVSAPVDSHHAPRFWSYDDGALVSEVSAAFQHHYEESLANNQFEFPVHMHGSVTKLKEDILLYERKRRNSRTMMITQGFDQPKILAHRHFDKTFFSLIVIYGGKEDSRDKTGEDIGVKDRENGNKSIFGERLYMVHDGILGIYDPQTLQSLSDIAIPAISEDIPNINSHGAKKRLMLYQVGITQDGRYFLIANMGGGNERKYLDIIQLKKQRYKQRLSLPKTTPLRFFGSGIHFLCKDKKQGLACFPAHYCLSKIAERGHDYDYRSVVQTGRFLSCDESVGCSIENHSHNIHVWQIQPLASMHVLRGHTHEVTSVDISPNNLLLVSGSYDNTVRLWDLQAGAQLATFHTGGAVDGVVLSPTMSHIGVQCYSAPQRKRALSLKINNSNPKSESGGD